MIDLLDTDHLSLDQRGHAQVRQRLQHAGPEQGAISVVTVGEQLRGWLAVIRNAATSESRVTGYLRVRMAAEYFASLTVLDYSPDADRLVLSLRQRGVRLGTHDLRIAAVALAGGAIVVTRNARDFRQVFGPRIVDWSPPGIDRAVAKRDVALMHARTRRGRRRERAGGPDSSLLAAQSAA